MPNLYTKALLQLIIIPYASGATTKHPPAALRGNRPSPKDTALANLRGLLYVCRVKTNDRATLSIAAIHKDFIGTFQANIMELKINIQYSELFELIKQLPTSQINQLAVDLSEITLTRKAQTAKKTLRALLLSGPVMSDEQYENYEKIIVQKEPAKRPTFGCGSVKISPSEDFDEPLEDFKDYM